MRSVQVCPRPEQQYGLLWHEVAQQVSQLRAALTQHDHARLQSLLSTLPSLVAQLEAMAARAGGLPASGGGEVAAAVRAIRQDLATCRQLIADRLAVVRWELRLLGALTRPVDLQSRPAGTSSACQLDLRI